MDKQLACQNKSNYNSGVSSDKTPTTHRTTTSAQISTSSTATAETTAIAIDVDSEGKKVNFAIRYLRRVLKVHGINYALIPDEAPTSRNNSPGEGVISPLEAIAIHTLVWLLAKYDKGESFMLLLDMIAV